MQRSTGNIFCLFVNSYSYTSQVYPSLTTITYLFRFFLHWKYSIVNSFYSLFFYCLTFLSSVKLMLINHQYLFIFSTAHLQSRLSNCCPFSTHQKRFMHIKSLPLHINIEIIFRSNMLVLMSRQLKTKTITVESFVEIYFRLTVNLQTNIVLTIVDLS